PNTLHHIRWVPDALPLAPRCNSNWSNGQFVVTTPGVNEDDSTFDTTLDDMLIARVVTNGANSPTITSLANANRLHGVFISNNVAASPVGVNGATITPSVAYNWARIPTVMASPRYHNYQPFGDDSSTPADAYWDDDFSIFVSARSRYGASAEHLRDMISEGAATFLCVA
ncbi:MAG: hypothetical protein ACRCYS_05405, partial [Beijerinckiaceae bacterium]